MGMLVNGQWQDVWYDTRSSGGRFVREDAHFRNWVSADGSAGPEGRDGFKAEFDVRLYRPASSVDRAREIALATLDLHCLQVSKRAKPVVTQATKTHVRFANGCHRDS